MLKNKRAPPHLRAARREAKAALAAASSASASSSSPDDVIWYGPERYSKLVYLSRGSFGKVFKAEGPAGKLVAIKAMMEQQASESPGPRQEVGLLSSLRHRHVVKILDSFQAKMPDSVFEDELVQHIVMEYCPSNLSQLIESTRLTFLEVARYMSQVCDGLAYVHGHKVVHRDLKPANILLNTEGVVKIADFGAARQICSKRDMERGVGTAWYCAPELSDPVYKGSCVPTSTLADMWSVGCILAEMMTNELLFKAPTPEAVLTQMLSLYDDGSIETWLAQETESCVLRATSPWSLTQWEYACVCLLERLVAFEPSERLSARDARKMFLPPTDAGEIADEPLAG
ncbi:Cell division control protein 2 [Geranomyces variabilis]|nr:Cell division control protein 2 [Geranomyces variabilis]